ncbi:UNVERIFIED_CONTAM: hypothetical protein FKN15_042573 [Acipenser sinensis]
MRPQLLIRSLCLLPASSHAVTVSLCVSPALFPGDQNAMNELIQMRLSAGGGGRMMAEKLEALITQTRAKQAATMSEVEWRGRTIPVKIDKVRIFLLGLADNEAAIAQAASEETKERLYESLLSESRDAIQAVREELKADAVRRGDETEGGFVLRDWPVPAPIGGGGRCVTGEGYVSPAVIYHLNAFLKFVLYLGTIPQCEIRQLWAVQGVR